MKWRAMLRICQNSLANILWVDDSGIRAWYYMCIYRVPGPQQRAKSSPNTSNMSPKGQPFRTYLWARKIRARCHILLQSLQQSRWIRSNSSCLLLQWHWEPWCNSSSRVDMPLPAGPNTHTTFKVCDFKAH